VTAAKKSGSGKYGGMYLQRLRELFAPHTRARCAYRHHRKRSDAQRLAMNSIARASRQRRLSGS
jgi:hypothetical protein